jgi:hypothetical protein
VSAVTAILVAQIVLTIVLTIIVFVRPSITAGVSL